MHIPELVCYTPTDNGKTLSIIHSENILFPYVPPARRVNPMTWDDTPVPSLRHRWEGSTDRCVTLQHIAQELPQIYKDLPTIPESVMLLFWTSVCSFLIHEIDGRTKILSSALPELSSANERKWRHRRDSVLNGVQYYWVGTLTSCYDSKWIDSLDHHHSKNVYDFILVGTKLWSSQRSLKVMRVGWDGSVAMRCDIGEIDEDAWVSNQPEWKLVALR